MLLVDAEKAAELRDFLDRLGRCVADREVWDLLMAWTPTVTVRTLTPVSEGGEAVEIRPLTVTERDHLMRTRDDLARQLETLRGQFSAVAGQRDELRAENERLRRAKVVRLSECPEVLKMVSRWRLGCEDLVGPPTDYDLRKTKKLLRAAEDAVLGEGE